MTQPDFTGSESTSFLYSEEEASTRPRQLQSRTSASVPFVLLGLGILLAAWIVLSTKTEHLYESPSQAMLGHIPTKNIIFKPDATYNVDPFGPDEIDTPWNTLAPMGKGHIKVDNPARWKLSGGFPLDASGSLPAEEYTIAMFHQLHCLAAIKSKMSRLQDWYEGGNDNEYLRFALGEDQVSDEHIYHCFDYLRQTLACHGDTTLEKARTVTVNGVPKTVRGVDGWGVEHQCRDYSAIYSFAEAQRSRDDTGIA